MLTIGQMARSQGVSTKTLRHYDSIGLFSPTLNGQDMQPDEGIEFEYSGARFLGPMHPENVTEIYIPLK